MSVLIGVDRRQPRDRMPNQGKAPHDDALNWSTNGTHAMEPRASTADYNKGTGEYIAL
jgi:hypothetical protein